MEGGGGGWRVEGRSRKDSLKYVTEEKLWRLHVVKRLNWLEELGNNITHRLQNFQGWTVGKKDMSKGKVHAIGVKRTVA